MLHLIIAHYIINYYCSKFSILILTQMIGYLFCENLLINIVNICLKFPPRNIFILFIKQLTAVYTTILNLWFAIYLFILCYCLL